MPRDSRERVAIAVLARAPVPGLAKTRLIPALGAHGAAVLQERFTARSVATACESAIGPVTLWGTPDITHPAFREIVARHGVALARQPEGDLGERMLAAVAAARGPALVLGTDCPALRAEHLRACAEALRAESDAVAIPAEDGGYVLIGLRRPRAELFHGMVWGVATVMEETRARARAAGLSLVERAPLWDVDLPEDIERCEREGIDLWDF